MFPYPLPWKITPDAPLIATIVIATIVIATTTSTF
jgi:preprotein translocase subunit Sec61beta